MCVNCGFCESVCPTLPAAGFRPIVGARGRVNLAKFLLGQVGNDRKSDLRISEAFYSCLDCYACVQVCPAGVNAGKVSQIGKQIIVNGQLLGTDQEEPVARMIVEATKRFGNPLGVRTQCSGWAKGLEFDEDSDTLLYTGNMYQLMAYNSSLARLEALMGERMTSFIAKVAAGHPSVLYFSRFVVSKRLENRMNSYLRAIYTLLKSSGLQFNYLGKDEPYPGTLMHDFGYQEEFIKYGAGVVNLFKERGVKTIVTVDPHTYDILRNKYPKHFSGFDFNVVYYLDYLKEMEFEKEDAAVTFHEPCYFVLREDTYSTPPQLLSKIARVTYPQRSGKRTMCCGGPDEALYAGLSQRISEERSSQLKAAGTKRTITACPICYSNLSGDGAVEDISGFLASHMKGHGS